MKMRVGLTMGDPAGVGPEIILKALAQSHLSQAISPVIFGDYAFLEHVWRRLRRHNSFVNRFKRVSIDSYFKNLGVARAHGAIVVDCSNAPYRKILMGKPSQIGGRASGDYIQHAIRAAQKGFIDAVVTAPINKISFKLGGWGARYIGHTEMLTHLTRARKTALMLVWRHLRAVHVTSHIPLRRVPFSIARKRVEDTIDLTYLGLQSLGIRRPRLAVCGINPHAGDDGVLGNEETRFITPAVLSRRRRGIDVSGPLPADIVWPRVLAHDFDAGIAMYHDQGQIPVKLMAMTKTVSGRMEMRGVNVTLGLPIIRTSPAHGTAYDIAGQGIASEKSLIEAIRLAEVLTKNKSKLYDTIPRS